MFSTGLAGWRLRLLGSALISSGKLKLFSLQWCMQRRVIRCCHLDHVSLLCRSPYSKDWLSYFLLAAVGDKTHYAGYHPQQVCSALYWFDVDHFVDQYYASRFFLGLSIVVSCVEHCSSGRYRNNSFMGIHRSRHLQTAVDHSVDNRSQICHTSVSMCAGIGKDVNF